MVSGSTGVVMSAMAARRTGSRTHSMWLVLSGPGVKAPEASGLSAMPVIDCSPTGPESPLAKAADEDCGTKPRLTKMVPPSAVSSGVITQ